MVFRTAYRITGNAADAEDVLQTVFLRLVRREGALIGVESNESYLRRAAVNAAIDVVRRGRNAQSIALEDAPPGPATSSPPGRETESREFQDRLRQALSRLPAREAEVFALRFLEDRGNQEIARMLGISQVHVAVILHRTRRQMQKELSSYAGEQR